jgi:sugar/nucleoside kinase (ribokinase family)
MGDVVVVGNVGIDTNVYMPGAEVDFDVEANFTQNLDYVGQAGGYASRGYARLGKRTAFIGHVGDDYHGRFIRETFARDGIDAEALFSDPMGTARSINFMYQDGRRKNFYDGKGHMTLQPDLEICRSIIARARLAHFNIPNWARHLLPVARELGLIVACDVQDVVTVDDAYRRDFVQSADVLFCSAVNYPDPTSIIEAFLVASPDQIVVVGMGAEGCALGTRDRVQFFPAVDIDVPVVDTNGAGDGLAVGFLTSYVLDGYSLTDSICRGQITARHTCTLKASSSSLITMEELEGLFREKGRTVANGEDDLKSALG